MAFVVGKSRSVLDRQWSQYSRPQDGFILNPESPQAEGLLGWWATNPDGAFVNRLTGVMAPRRLASATLGIEQRDTNTWPSDFGMAAYSTSSGNKQTWYQTPFPGVLDRLSALTITYWVFMPNAMIGGTTYAQWGQGDSSTSTFHKADNVGTQGIFFRGGADLRGLFTDPLINAANQYVWLHVAWRASGATATGSTNFCLNGVQQQSVTGGPNNITVAATSAFGLLGTPDQGGAAIGCSCASVDFRVYNRTLSDREIYGLWEPTTRWDLYWKPQRLYLDLGAPPAATLFRLTVLGAG